MGLFACCEKVQKNCWSSKELFVLPYSPRSSYLEILDKQVGGCAPASHLFTFVQFYLLNIHSWYCSCHCTLKCGCAVVFPVPNCEWLSLKGLEGWMGGCSHTMTAFSFPSAVYSLVLKTPSSWVFIVDMVILVGSEGSPSKWEYSVILGIESRQNEDNQVFPCCHTQRGAEQPQLML